jgi:hypothetical protein
VDKEPKDQDFKDLDKDNKALTKATTPADTEPEPDPAREAELERQQMVQEAVALANEEELPKLGGPIMNPGNPELDAED